MEVVLTGLNTPTRIGEAIVLPGDLVITDKEGVLFIPAHMAEMVIGTAEFMTSRASFSRAMLREGRYSSGQMDSQWTDYCLLLIYQTCYSIRIRILANSMS